MMVPKLSRNRCIKMVVAMATSAAKSVINALQNPQPLIRKINNPSWANVSLRFPMGLP